MKAPGTGILDFFFERYIEDNRRRPMPFQEWLDTIYDPASLKRPFRSTGWASRLGQCPRHHAKLV